VQQERVGIGPKLHGDEWQKLKGPVIVAKLDRLSRDAFYEQSIRRAGRKESQLAEAVQR
jgi:hypothetical protein